MSSNRFLREYLFDGVFSHVAGIGRVFLNELFAQPWRTSSRHQDHLFPEAYFPFAAAPTADPVSGSTASLLRGDGFDPLLIETNTPTEYWQKGASLLHPIPRGNWISTTCRAHGSIASLAPSTVDAAAAPPTAAPTGT